MQLTDLQLIEVKTTSTEFKKNGPLKGGGNITTDYGPINFEAGGALKSDPTKAVVVVTGSPMVSGTAEGFDGSVFTLKMSMKMVYTYPITEAVDQKFLEDNLWYFLSFLKAYFKTYADQIFSQTEISRVNLPYS